MNKPGRFAPESHTPWIADVSAQGFRADHEYAHDRTPGRSRIAILGDSFTYGYEVNDDQAYPAQVQAALPNAEVLNFGVPGFGLDQIDLRYKQELSSFHPDIVVVTLVSLLADRCASTFTSWYKPSFALGPAGDLILRGVPVPSPDEAYRRYVSTPRLLDLIDILVSSATPIHAPDALVTAILQDLVDAIHASGARPVVMLAPTFWEYDGPSAAQQPFDNVCRRGHVECLNTLPAFHQANASGVLKGWPGVHWNPAGDKLAADKLVEYLKAHPTAVYEGS